MNPCFIQGLIFLRLPKFQIQMIGYNSMMKIRTKGIDQFFDCHIYIFSIGSSYMANNNGNLSRINPKGEV